MDDSDLGKFFLSKNCRHGVFVYPKNDLYVGRSLDLYGEWCEHELTLLGQLIRSQDVVLDIGANLGTHTVFFAKHVNTVLSFEPQKNIFTVLCENITRNNLKNVRCFKKGVGEFNTQKNFPLTDLTKPGNYGGFSLQPTAEGDCVDIVTVDSLNLSSCRLIKIDVEGMEYDVIKGAQETLKRCKPILYVENNDQTGKSPLIKELLDSGYVCYWHLTPYYNENNFFHNPQDVFKNISTNMLCFPSSVKVNCSFEPVIGPTDTSEKCLKRIRMKNNKNGTTE